MTKTYKRFLSVAIDIYFIETPEYEDPEEILEDYIDDVYEEGAFIHWEFFEEWDKEYMIANIVDTTNKFHGLYQLLQKEKNKNKYE